MSAQRALIVRLVLLAGVVVLAGGGGAGAAGPVGPTSLVEVSTPPAGVPMPEGASRAVARKRLRGERLSAAERAELRAQRVASRRAFRGLGRGGAVAAFASEHRELVRDGGFSPLAGVKVDEIRSEHAAVVVSPQEGKRRPSLMVSSAPLATENAAGDLVAVDKSLQAVPGGFVPDVTADALVIGDEATDPIAVGDQGDLQVRALGVTESPGVLEQDTVVYPNVMRDTDLAVQPAPQGVQTFHQLRSPESPETVSLALSMPDGAMLAGDGETGWKIVRGDDVLGTVTAPVAFDANQEPLAVETVVAGSVLEMTVRHRDAEVQYPVVIDPVIERSSHNTQIWGWGNAYHGWTNTTYGTTGIADMWTTHPEYVPYALGISLPPYPYIPSANAQWHYWAGGATARIWWAKFYGWGMPYHGAGSAFTGLWAASRNTWETNQYGAQQAWSQTGTFDGWNPTYCPLPASQPTWANPEPGCIDWGGTYNNLAIHGLFANSAAWSVAVIRGFGVAIADWHPPGVNVNTTTSWTADSQVAVSAGDDGLGVKQVIIQAPNQPQWDGAINHTFGCDGSTWRSCPREYTFGAPGKIPVRIGNLPKGRNHTLRVWVYDAVGNVMAAPRDFVVGVAAPATDRALYREDGSPNVWVMMGGKKHWVTSPGVAAAAGLNLANVVSVPTGNLASYARGPDVIPTTATSWRYGGGNASIDVEGDADAVIAAMRPGGLAEAQSLYDGIAPGEEELVDRRFPEDLDQRFDLFHLKMRADTTQVVSSHTQYSYKEGSYSSKPVDPIGLVFVGPKAKAQEVRVSLSNVMGWGSGETQSSQFINGNGTWLKMQAENASSGGLTTGRTHVRLGTWPLMTRISGGRWGDYTVGTPHKDVYSWSSGCVIGGVTPIPGHVARDFVGARRDIAHAYQQQGRTVRARWWGNTGKMKQCDGSRVASNGWVSYVYTK